MGRTLSIYVKDGKLRLEVKEGKLEAEDLRRGLR